ncbi:hypothetical protein [Streptomyces sp. NPDC053431]|uniref:hypothetical protein n=1 Tax=Streptomyces sp. NPDC053431 TaxID=3365703 RepID=UPI0037D889CB
MLPWVRKGFESHEGTAAALPANGSEPRPGVLDAGSGGHLQESSEGSRHGGTLGRPTAPSMRGSCTCGWRGERTYPLDREHTWPDDRDVHDTSGPKRDWEAHMEQVAARAVALPDDLAVLLDQLRDRLDALLDDAPLTALKAADALESVVASTGPVAALFLTRAADVLPMARIAELLGMTEQAAGSRLAHYRHLNR